MSREEEKYKAATESWDKQGFKNQEQKIPYKLGFLEGFDYADQHPREGLWDGEKVEKVLGNLLFNKEQKIYRAYLDYDAFFEDLHKAMEEDLKKKKNEQDNKCSVLNISDKYKPSKEAYQEIFRIMNRRRPYCPSDFKKQSFIPDLD